MFGNDITMCLGDGCPLKNKCYRHTAKPDEYWQSYFVTPPYSKETSSCDDYWDNTEYKKENKNGK